MATRYPVQLQPGSREFHGHNCCCPTCRGLVLKDRPLFGAGQVLTAADLTALQDYVRAKNRLHSRYLHGWGVVCGLEVICNDCEGSVTVKPGYALDPCGEDIIVAEPVRFDLVKAIRACADQQRVKTGDCDPWMPPPDPGCTDAETHWCVALKYREVETAFVPSLVAGRAASGCGCGGVRGCGGNCGGGCGCGGMSQKTTSPNAMAALTNRITSLNNSCAPRRVQECFEITAIPSKEGCAPVLFTRGNDQIGGSLLGVWDQFIPEGTLLRKIVDCVANDIRDLMLRLKSGDGALLGRVVTESDDQLLQANVSLSAIHAAFCAFKQAILAKLAADTDPTRCQMRQAAAEIVLPAPRPPPPPVAGVPPQSNAQQTAWLDQARAGITDLLAVWIQTILDCVCHALLPQCDDDPCDDRVAIACVTLKGGKILSICNHSCRRYAGAFPSMSYWLSIVPILPLIAKFLAFLCCQPDLLRRNSPLVNDLVPLLDRIDPTGNLRSVIVANNFALPRAYLARLADVGQVPFITRIAHSLDIAGATTSYTGSEVRIAEQKLAAAGVKFEVTTLALGDEAKVVSEMRLGPLLRRGDTVRLYTRDGKVMATVRDDALAATQSEEVAALRRELAELRESVANLANAGSAHRGQS
jgi:hypothetical protein